MKSLSNLDGKTLLIGLALGILVAAAIGAGTGSANSSDFGIAVGANSALVKTADGSMFVINTDTAMAHLVLIDYVKSRPTDRRDSNRDKFNLNSTITKSKRRTRTIGNP